MTRNRNGFTLVELIVTIVIAGVAGAALVQLMGTSLIRSADPVHLSSEEALVERQLEQVVSNYVAAMNALDFSSGNPDPQTVLTALNTGITSGSFNSGKVQVSANFIDFVNGAETTVVGPSNTLRVTSARMDGGESTFALTTLLTVTRNNNNRIGVRY